MNTPGSETHRGRRPFRRTKVVVAIALAISGFAFHYGIERAFDRTEVFNQFNVLFQADPNERIGAMSHGWGRSGRNVAHPNLSNFTSPFVRTAAFVAAKTGLTDDQVATRRSLGMLIVPLARAATNVVLFTLLLRLGMSILTATLLTLLSMLSFSTVIFGSIPDHFALSALVIVGAYHLLLDAVDRGAMRWKAWFIAMVLAAGITVTNVAIIAILMVAAMWRLDAARLRALALAATMATATLAVTYVGSSILTRIFRGNQIDRAQSQTWLTTFWDARRFPARFVRFPIAVGNTIAPAAIGIGDPTLSFRPDDRYQFRFTLEETPPGGRAARNVIALIAMLLVALGVRWSLRSRDTLAVAGMASAAVLAFNWLLHAFWGDETFLYSQHWLIALVVLIAVWFHSAHRVRLRSWLLATLVAATGVNSLLLLRHIMEALGSA